MGQPNLHGSCEQSFFTTPSERGKLQSSRELSASAEKFARDAKEQEQRRLSIAAQIEALQKQQALAEQLEQENRAREKRDKAAAKKQLFKEQCDERRQILVKSLDDHVVRDIRETAQEDEGLRVAIQNLSEFVKHHDENDTPDGDSVCTVQASLLRALIGGDTELVLEFVQRVDLQTPEDDDQILKEFSTIDPKSNSIRGDPHADIQGHHNTSTSLTEPVTTVLSSQIRCESGNPNLESEVYNSSSKTTTSSIRPTIELSSTVGPDSTTRTGPDNDLPSGLSSNLPQMVWVPTPQPQDRNPALSDGILTTTPNRSGAVETDDVSYLRTVWHGLQDGDTSTAVVKREDSLEPYAISLTGNEIRTQGQDLTDLFGGPKKRRRNDYSVDSLDSNASMNKKLTAKKPRAIPVTPAIQRYTEALDFLVEQNSPVKPELNCVRCKKTPLEPRLSACNHLYCNNCLKDNRKVSNKECSAFGCNQKLSGKPSKISPAQYTRLLSRYATQTAQEEEAAISNADAGHYETGAEDGETHNERDEAEAMDVAE